MEIKAGFSRFPSGGDKRDRTADLLNAIQALSQLSYTPMSVKTNGNLIFCRSLKPRFTGKPQACQLRTVFILPKATPFVKHNFKKFLGNFPAGQAPLPGRLQPPRRAVIIAVRRRRAAAPPGA